VLFAFSFLREEPTCHPERSAHGARSEGPAFGGIHEGAVLRVRFGAQNLPDWSSAVLDKEEERRWLREAKQMLDEMKRSDPGGDIQL
jgi:hypothetical protein